MISTEGNGRAAAGGLPAVSQSSTEAPATTPAVEPRLLRLREAAELLALSERTVGRMARAGELPGVVRIGRSRRVDRRALESWIDRGCPQHGGRRAKR
jgi:excisionase family DNA binding protein